MSERVIKKDFRQTKEIKLPSCGVSVVIYNSVLAGDIGSITKIEGDTFNTNLAILVKVIKSWNMFGSEEATEALPVNLENLQALPASDIEYLSQEMVAFADEVKKNTQS